MFKRLQNLGQIYYKLEKSGFEGKTYFEQCCKSPYDALCVYESLKLQEMEKILRELRELAKAISWYKIFERSKMKDCLQDCQLRYVIKRYQYNYNRDRQKDKVWKKKQMMGLLDPVHTNLVIFTRSNGEKVFTNPHLVQRKYQRVINDANEMSSIATETSLNNSELLPLNKYK